jgi:hypothetical protein
VLTAEELTMASHTYNPEKNDFRGVSYKCGCKSLAKLRARSDKRHARVVAKLEAKYGDTTTMTRDEV